MKAVIIYHDFASAAKANSALQRSAQHPDIDIEWNIRPWRVDMLKFPPIADEALADAIDAHLIVFAGRIAQSLPFWLKDWLEQWAKCRQVKDPALTTIGGEIGEAGTLSPTPELLRFARQHRLRFIFDGSLLGEGAAELPLHIIPEDEIPPPGSRPAL